MGMIGTPLLDSVEYLKNASAANPIDVATKTQFEEASAILEVRGYDNQRSYRVDVFSGPQFQHLLAAARKQHTHLNFDSRFQVLVRCSGGHLYFSIDDTEVQPIFNLQHRHSLGEAQERFITTVKSQLNLK